MDLGKKAILAIIPLIAMVFITTYNDNVFSEEDDLQCPAGEVVVVRTTNPNPICVEESTAHKWVRYGMATIVESFTSDEVEEARETMTGEEFEAIAEEKMEEQQEELEAAQEEAMEEAIEEAMTEATMEDSMEVMEEKTMDEMMKPHGWITTTGTLDSMTDPGLGHETHQLTIILPPSDKVYKGILTYDASEPIQLVALHGPLAEGEDNGQAIWTPDGETKYALTLIDSENSMGSWLFTGNALAVHTMNEDTFTISYSVSYMEKETSETVMSGTLSSMLDPGIGHETHQLAIILPPNEKTYSGLLTYSASEPIQLVALHGPLGPDEDKGQAIWTTDGETKYALTFVDAESDAGTWVFAGNALAVHTMNEDTFTISYSVAAGLN